MHKKKNENYERHKLEKAEEKKRKEIDKKLDKLKESIRKPRKPRSKLSSKTKPSGRQKKSPKPKAKGRKKLRRLSLVKKDARYWFQRWIRLTKADGGVNCIYGCGRWLTDIKTFDSCHFLSVQLYPSATFDVDNVYPGCKGCNKRDPILEYRKNLVRIKGEEWVKELEDKYKLNRGTYKWDRTYLQEIIDTYKQKCKEIENS